MPALDLTKPVRLVDGGTRRPARILCTDRGAPGLPVVALYGSPGNEGVACLRADGTHPSGCYHLENIPERVTQYANIYGPSTASEKFRFGAMYTHPELRSCEQSGYGAIGRIALTFEGGVLVEAKAL